METIKRAGEVWLPLVMTVLMVGALIGMWVVAPHTSIPLLFLILTGIVTIAIIKIMGRVVYDLVMYVAVGREF